MAERPLIAVVDDDKSIRNATQDLLKAAGFSAATFEDARSFLVSASRVRTDCLVADMRMPGMTGLELHLELVASGHTIPTVIMSAHTEELARARERDVGIICYLSKPFVPDELLACVRKGLAKANGHSTILRS